MLRKITSSPYSETALCRDTNTAQNSRNAASRQLNSADRAHFIPISPAPFQPRLRGPSTHPPAARAQRARRLPPLRPPAPRHPLARGVRGRVRVRGRGSHLSLEYSSCSSRLLRMKAMEPPGLPAAAAAVAAGRARPRLREAGRAGPARRVGRVPALSFLPLPLPLLFPSLKLRLCWFSSPQVPRSNPRRQLAAGPVPEVVSGGMFWGWGWGCPSPWGLFRAGMQASSSSQGFKT